MDKSKFFIIEGILIDGRRAFFDFSAIEKITFNYSHDIFTVELYDSRCFNCKLSSYCLHPGLAFSEYGIID